MKILKSLALVLSLFLISFSVFAAGGKAHLDHADTDIMDKASLQNGAKPVSYTHLTLPTIYSV